MYFLSDKKFYFRYFFLGLVVFFGIILGTLWVKGKDVFALSSNYSKLPSSALSISEWNQIANDFLAKSGGLNGIMSDLLDLSLYRIIGVGNPIDAADAVNKNYISTSLSSYGGGSVFVNWGRNDCPASSDKLYDGFAFGSEYADFGGGNNIVCLQAGGAGTEFKATEHSLIQPLVTVNYAQSFPESFPIGKFMRCSVCYNSNSSCYIKTGDWTCDGLYSPVYEGYMAGAIITAGLNYTTRDRTCLNKDFDGTAVSGADATSGTKGIVQGTVIGGNLGFAAYNPKHFTKCAVCCN